MRGLPCCLVGLMMGVSATVWAGNSDSSAIGLWRYAKPLANAETAPEGSVLEFKAPSEHFAISLAFRFYNSGIGCGGTVITKTYNLCTDATHAGQEYGISPSSLYKMANGKNISNATRVCQVSAGTPFILQNISCDGDTDTCTLNGGTVSLQTLTNNTAC